MPLKYDIILKNRSKGENMLNYESLSEKNNSSSFSGRAVYVCTVGGGTGAFS